MANKTIGWQSPKFIQAKAVLVTVNAPRRLVNGTEMPPIYRALKPNHLGQYVLEADAPDYNEQLKAMREKAKLFGLEEIPAEAIGKLTPEQAEQIDLMSKTPEEQVESLKQKLEKMKKMYAENKGK